MGSLKFVFLLSIVGADNWDLTGNKNCYLEDYPFRLGSYEADSRVYCYLRSQNTDAVYEFPADCDLAGGPRSDGHCGATTRHKQPADSDDLEREPGEPETTRFRTT